MAAAASILLFLLLLPPSTTSDTASDIKNLLLFKSSLSDPLSNLASWNPQTPLCEWRGIVCLKGKETVSTLQLENLTLSGSINVDALSNFDFRGLSLYNNSFSGPIPPFNKLSGLRNLYLTNNKFSGQIPDDFFATMTLRKLVLSGNQFIGPIPSSLSKISNLKFLHIGRNQFSGPIPDLPASITDLDLSGNHLTGPIPPSLNKHEASAFANNPGLCGPPLPPCQILLPPPLAAAGEAPVPKNIEGGKGETLIMCIGVGLFAGLILFMMVVLRKKGEKHFDTLGVDNNGQMEAGQGKRKVAAEGTAAVGAGSIEEGSVGKGVGAGGGGSTRGHKRGGSTGLKGGGDLVMVNEEKGVVVLADLMKAAAEVMGNGGMSSAYKAVLRNGLTVAVKRMKEMNRLGKEMFDVELRRMGRLKHPNVLVPLAYHYRKEEKLLLFEFIPKGSLMYILHGDRGPDHAALNWPTRFKIILGIARGMAYIHTELTSIDIPHGNLKSGNVLLTNNFEPLLVDFGFLSLVNPSTASDTMFAYKSPESLNERHVSPKSDVYCFGIIILEVLTGKFPSQYLNNTKGGTDVIAWANSTILENRVPELLDPAITSTAKPEIPKMESLIRIGASCVEPNPDERPNMKEVCERIEGVARQESVTEPLGNLSGSRAGSLQEKSEACGDTSSFSIS